MRGYKLGLLTTSDYNNLCQCETLEDIKLYLVRRTAAAAKRAAVGRPHSRAMPVLLLGPHQAAALRLVCAWVLARCVLKAFLAAPLTACRPPRRAVFCPPQTGTDYGPFLANEASPMHTTTLVDCCTRKLVADWRYLRENVREDIWGRQLGPVQGSTP